MSLLNMNILVSSAYSLTDLDALYRMVMMIQMSWQVNEEVSRDMTVEADVMKTFIRQWRQHNKNTNTQTEIQMNQKVYSRDGVMHIWMSALWFSTSTRQCIGTVNGTSLPLAHRRPVVLLVRVQCTSRNAQRGMGVIVVLVLRHSMYFCDDMRQNDCHISVHCVRDLWQFDLVQSVTPDWRG